MKCAFQIIRYESDGSSRVMASWRNFPPIIVWFMANMDDGILDEEEHPFEIEKLGILCQLCRDALSAQDWLDRACNLWGLSAEECRENEAVAFCVQGMTNEVLLQGEMIAPPTDGAKLVCKVSRQ